MTIIKWSYFTVVIIFQACNCNIENRNKEPGFYLRFNLFCWVSGRFITLLQIEAFEPADNIFSNKTQILDVKMRTRLSKSFFCLSWNTCPLRDTSVLNTVHVRSWLNSVFCSFHWKILILRMIVLWRERNFKELNGFTLVPVSSIFHAYFQMILQQIRTNSELESTILPGNTPEG